MIGDDHVTSKRGDNGEVDHRARNRRHELVVDDNDLVVSKGKRVLHRAAARATPAGRTNRDVHRGGPIADDRKPVDRCGRPVRKHRSNLPSLGNRSYPQQVACSPV